MKIQLVAMIALVILLAGCTVNPGDLAPKTQARNTNGAGGQLTGAGIQNSSSGANPAPLQITLDAAEVAKHNTANDCWMIINGVVYDLTSYSNHPGGSAYVPYCGTDGTSAFDTKGGRGNPHSSYASSLLPDFQVGSLGQTITLSGAGSGTAGGNVTGLPKGGINSTGRNNAGSRSGREYED